MSSNADFPPTARLVRSSNQISGDIDGKVVLLSVQNGEYYNMNGVGSRIWQLLEQPTTVAELLAKLQEEFEVDAATCEREVTAFLVKLQKDGLLQTEAARA